jgi:hypothetical protein
MNFLRFLFSGPDSDEEGISSSPPLPTQSPEPKVLTASLPPVPPPPPPPLMSTAVPAQLQATVGPFPPLKQRQNNNWDRHKKGYRVRTGKVVKNRPNTLNISQTRMNFLQNPELVAVQTPIPVPANQQWGVPTFIHGPQQQPNPIVSNFQWVNPVPRSAWNPQPHVPPQWVQYRTMPDYWGLQPQLQYSHGSVIQQQLPPNPNPNGWM